MKDIKFKLSGNRQYAEVQVNGKTGTRSVPLINSIPYVKDYLDEHPQKNNPNAYFIFGNFKSYGKKLSSEAIYCVYSNYQKVFFPKLLQDPKISPEDKIKIKELLQKPWNPYIRRHTGLTEKSKILKEGVLRAYSGWSQGSKMHMRYVHYFGNEANESILEAYGLKPKIEEIDKMKPRQCPNCNELNKIDSKFCVKCRMVLSYDSYMETVKQQEERVDFNERVLNTIELMAERIESLEKQSK